MPEHNLITLPNNNQIYIRIWQNECVIYNRKTGSTHLLDGIGARVFTVIFKQPATFNELLQTITDTPGLSAEFDAESVLTEFIAEYHSLGLIDITDISAA